jgi:predicted alpha/beta-hydrolase family hydrolase
MISNESKSMFDAQCRVVYGVGMTALLIAGPTTPRARLLFAHGAGGPMDTPFMTSMAELLADRDIGTLRFEFPYMAARRTGGTKKPAPKADTLVPAYRDAIGCGPRDGVPLFIGGKSMGGRVASLIADEAYAARRVRGLVCLGYPFHPPSAPDNLRTAHLRELLCPALIVQGERDPFGTRAEIEALMADFQVSSAIRFAWIGDGDHDFGPRGGQGFTRKGNLAAAADAVADFVSQLV